MEKYKELIEFLKVEISKIDADAKIESSDLYFIASNIAIHFKPVKLISNELYHYYIVGNRIVLIEYDVCYPNSDFEEIHLRDITFVDLNRVMTIIRHSINNLEDAIKSYNEDILKLKALAYDLNKK